MNNEKPSLIYSFLSEPNLYAIFLKIFFIFKKQKPHFFLGIRNANVKLSDYPFFSKVTFLACSVLSFLPDLIICNSEAGKLSHSRFFKKNKLTVHENGLDLDQFYYDLNSTKAFKKNYEIKDAPLFIGHVARIDPIKNQMLYLKAIQRLPDDLLSQCHFFLVGYGNGNLYAELKSYSKKETLPLTFLHLNGSPTLRAFYSMIDIICLTSDSEGYPNVIVEAMACGATPCVTESGDCKKIIHPFGGSSPIGEIDAYSACLKNEIENQLLEKNKPELKLKIENEIKKRYSREAFVSSFERFL